MHPATIRHSCPVRHGAFYHFRQAVSSPQPSAQPSSSVHPARRNPAPNREGDGPGSFLYFL
jgi:hypothetical protein